MTVLPLYRRVYRRSRAILVRVTLATIAKPVVGLRREASSISRRVAVLELAAAAALARMDRLHNENLALRNEVLAVTNRLNLAEDALPNRFADDARIIPALIETASAA